MEDFGELNHQNIIRILHVDDDVNHLEFIKRHLEKADKNLKVQSFSSIDEAFRFLKREDVDCIVSDYVMPEMNGLQLVIEIRKITSVPFILYTGQGNEKVAMEALSLGVNDYVLKASDLSHFHFLAKRIRVEVEKYITENKLREHELNYKSKITTLHNIAVKLNEAFDLEEMCAIVIETLKDILGFHWAGIGLVKGDSIIFVRYVGFDIPEGWRISLESPSISARTVKTGLVQLVSDVRKDSDYLSPPFNNKTKPPQILSALVVPVIMDGKVKAVINLESEELNAFDEDDQRLVETLALHMSLTLKRIIEESKRQIYEKKLEALHKYAVKLASADTMEKVAESTFEGIKNIFEYCAGGFGLIEEDYINYIYFTGVDTIEKSNILPLSKQTVSTKAVKLGKTQTVTDIKNDPFYTMIKYEGKSDFLSEIDVPIKIEGKVVAIITLKSRQKEAFNIQDKQLLETLCLHVASILNRIHKDKLVHYSLNELNRSNRELDDYTYAVSHDLKAPLRTIKAFSGFLSDDYNEKLDETGRDYIDRLVNASNRMQRLIDDLLILSRVGRVDTDIESVDLNDIIEEIKLDFETQLKSSEIKIIVSNLPSIDTQRVWIKQLFTNLISNGLKFNKSDTPTVWVGWEERWGDYMFSIMDNGIGIDKKDRDRIFKIFQRLHSEEEYPGTGAGLAICKKILQSFGGRIWVDDRVGSGSIFYFTYPKKRKENVINVEQETSFMQNMIEVQET